MFCLAEKQQPFAGALQGLLLMLAHHAGRLSDLSSNTHWKHMLLYHVVLNNLPYKLVILHNLWPCSAACFFISHLWLKISNHDFCSLGRCLASAARRTAILLKHCCWQFLQESRIGCCNSSALWIQTALLSALKGVRSHAGPMDLNEPGEGSECRGGTVVCALLFS